MNWLQGSSSFPPSTIRLDAIVESHAAPLSIDFTRFVLSTSEGQHTPDTIDPSGPSLRAVEPGRPETYTLRYTLPREYSQFTVQLGGIAASEGALDLLDVRFRAAREWYIWAD